MSTSTDPENFFQTADSQATRARRAAKADNQAGSPIKLLSKPLDLLCGPDGETVFVAESAGVVREIGLSSRKTATAFRPPASSTTTPSAPIPLTSLALSPSAATLYVGSWSHHIYAHPLAAPSSSSSSSTTTQAPTFHPPHTDFVKNLLALPTATASTRPLLASGSADKSVALWDGATGARLASLAAHARPVLCLAAPARGSLLYSGGSDGEVVVWKIGGGSGGGVDGKEAEEEVVAAEPVGRWRPHASSVTGLAFVPAGADHPFAGGLVSAGVDGKVRVGVWEGAVPGEENGGNKEVVLDHGEGNAVRALAVAGDGRYIVTGCRDEDVWVWDLEDLEGEDEGEEETVKGPKPRWKWEGHADEVVALCVVPETADRGEVIVSGSLDGTVRTWNVREGERGAGLGWKSWAGKVADDKKGEAKEAKEGNGIELSAEEQAELDALMDSD